ncbi:MAG: hypothetical protein R2784_16760 [Saprospiraceae bacterium]
MFSTTFGFLISKQLAFENKKWIKLAYFPYLIAPVVFGTMLQFYFNRFNLSGNIGGVDSPIAFHFSIQHIIVVTFWNERIKQMAFQASVGCQQPELYRKGVGSNGKTLVVHLFCTMLFDFLVRIRNNTSNRGRKSEDPDRSGHAFCKRSQPVFSRTGFLFDGFSGDNSPGSQQANIFKTN